MTGFTIYNLSLAMIGMTANEVGKWREYQEVRCFGVSVPSNSFLSVAWGHPRLLVALAALFAWLLNSMCWPYLVFTQAVTMDAVWPFA